MATQDETLPDGFNPIDSTPDDGDDELTLEPGDYFEGLILEISEGDGRYGTYQRMRLKPADGGEPQTYFAKDKAKAAATRGDVEEGDRIELYRGEEKVPAYSEEADDYYPTYIGTPEGDD